MVKTFREGILGALMDEYERAADELKVIINTTEQQDFVSKVDHETKDPDCVSIQTIMNHVVRSGYGYANYVKEQFGEPYAERKDRYEVDTTKSTCMELEQMLNYTDATLKNKLHLTFEELAKHKFKSRWEQDYDIEQLLEHAIVHILRHRRQIEKFLIKRRSTHV
jgi:uncharacterized damage-inducible protein DinB